MNNVCMYNEIVFLSHNVQGYLAEKKTKRLNNKRSLLFWPVYLQIAASLCFLTSEILAISFLSASEISR